MDHFWGMQHAPAALLTLAHEIDASHAHGAALRLSGEATREVMREWEDHYRQTPWPLPWRDVRRALTRRAMGDEWHPAKP